MRSVRPEWWLAVASVGVSLLLAELGARAWVSQRWPAEKTHQLSHPTATRGRYTTHPALPYVPAPGFRGKTVRHNDHGFRGAPIAVPRPPGQRRIVLMGASTVYGVMVGEQETSAVQLQKELTRRHPGLAIDVVNAGVPGWTSRETLLNLRARVANLEPDLVVVVDGRNELFPQVWRGYRDDYAHYRNVEYDMSRTNLVHKRLFRVSHLALLALTQGRGHLGFSNDAENPVYGSLEWRNQPTTAEAIAHAGRAEFGAGYEANLRAFVAEARQRGIRPLLATIAYRPEAFNSGVIGRKPKLLPAFGARVRANNELVRKVARETRVPLIPLDTLSDEEWLADDCHFHARGERRAAELMADGIDPALLRVASDASVLGERGPQDP